MKQHNSTLQQQSNEAASTPGSRVHAEPLSFLNRPAGFSPLDQRVHSRALGNIGHREVQRELL
jgi:hypothetical protein